MSRRNLKVRQDLPPPLLHVDRGGGDDVSQPVRLDRLAQRVGAPRALDGGGGALARLLVVETIGDIERSRAESGACGGGGLRNRFL